MPTEYTAPIKDGITFEAFALSCARAFGALVTMRDEPFDAPIPEEFPPSDYHAGELAKLRKELTELSDAEVDERARREHEAEVACIKQRDSEDKALRARYEAMLQQVRAWTPPTPEHEGLKRFMVEQITQSIHYDCDIPRELPAPKTGAEWYSARIAEIARLMAYHKKEQREEQDRAAERTRWVRDLRASLAP